MIEMHRENVGVDLGATAPKGEFVPASSSTPAASETWAINLEKVSRVYRRGSSDVPVLSDVTFRVEAGRFEAIMGPSGSGKTTLLNIVSGIDRATGGRVLVGGSDITRLSENALAEWRLHNVGLVFQFYNLVQVLTAYQNVELPLLLLKMSKSERRERVWNALKLVGLEDRADHLPKQLSGGQEQRVGIARAIVTDPPLIVADEPTGDLDAQTGTRVLELLKSLNQELGKTIMMVTHDPKAASFADIVHVMQSGQLVTKQNDAQGHAGGAPA